MIKSAQATLEGINSQSSSAQTKLGGMNKNPKDPKILSKKKKPNTMMLKIK